MQNVPTRTVFDVITDFLATDPSPREIIDYFLPNDLQARADYLAEQNGEGKLSYDEERELHEFMNADEMFALLKTKMKLRLKRQAEDNA